MTNSSPLILRPATPADAAFIARHVLEALHWEMYTLPLSTEKRAAWSELTFVCAQPDTLYSYRHATIAEMAGQPVGLLVAYEGERYRDLRLRTFSQLPTFRGTDLHEMADETAAGEYYIDSLAVAPTFRGHGIGRELLHHAIVVGQSAQLLPTLLVDPDNPTALRLYESVGFVHEGEVFAFDQLFWRMKVAAMASA